MARKPKTQLKAPKRRKATGGKRRFGAFTAVLMLLAIGIGGIVVALALSYDPATSPGGKKIAIGSKDAKTNVAKLPDGKKAATTAVKKPPPDNKKTQAKTQPKTASKLPATQNTAKDNGAKDQSAKTPGTKDSMPKTTGIKAAGTKAAGTKVAGTKAAGKITQPGVLTPGVLTKAPVAAIHETGKKGPIPKVAPDGRRASKVYARGIEPGKGPVIAIIISDLGANSYALSSVVKDLPPDVTLAFSPYAQELQAKVDAARGAGHEVLLEVPMEPLTYPNDDPGPLAMLTGLPARINIDRLEWTMGKFAGYVGVISRLGGRFGTSAPALRPVLQRMHNAGLLFVDNRSSNTVVPMKLSDKIGLPRAYVDRLIDRRPTRTEIENRLVELEKIAKAQGAAVGRGFAYPVTVERLAIWTLRLKQTGITLVPISALAGKQPVLN